MSPIRIISKGETSVVIERGIAETTEEYVLVFTPTGEWDHHFKSFIYTYEIGGIILNNDSIPYSLANVNVIDMIC